MITAAPRLAEVTRVTIPLPNLPKAFDGITLAQTSDWHLGEWMTRDKMLAIAHQVNELEPDVIIHTGDFTGRRLRHVLGDVTVVSQAFKAREGIFGILGNHDYFHFKSTDVIKAIEAAGNTPLLENANAYIQRGDSKLYFAGVDDVWEKQADILKALNGIPDGAAVVALVHEPDYADVVSATRRVGLQLSGHTHGGQFRLPGTGALVLPRYGKRYDMGLFNVNGMALYVNVGVGMIPPYVRFNCPAEITLITLKTED